MLDTQDIASPVSPGNESIPSNKPSSRKKGKGRKRRIPGYMRALLVLVILGGIAGGVYIWRAQATAAAAQPATIALPVSQGDLNVTVQSNGKVQATRQQSVTYETTGNVVEVLVKSGDKVAAGQPLVRQTDVDQKEAVASAQASLNTAKAKLEDLKKGPSEAEVNSATADVQSAQAALDALLAGSSKKDIADAQSDVRSAEANLAQVKAGATPKQLSDAQADLSTAQANLAKVKAGATAKDLSDAQADLSAAQANLAKVKAGATAKELSDAEADLKTAQAKYDVVMAPPSPSDVREAQSKLASVKAKLAALKAGPTAAKLSTAQLAVTQAEASRTSVQNQAALDKKTKQLALEKANRDLQQAQRTYATIAGDVLNENGEVTVPASNAKYTQYWTAYNAMKDAEAAQTQALDELNNVLKNEVDDVAAAQAKVDDAKKQLADVQAGATADEIASAQSDVDTAQKTLDTLVAPPSKDAVATAQADVTKAQNALNELKAGPTAADLATANTAVAKAQNALNDLKAGPTADEVATAQAAVVKAQNALNDLKAGPTKDAVATAQATVDKAHNNLNDLLAGATPDKVAAAKATVAQKQSSLAALVQPATASDLAAAEESVASAQKNLDSAEADLAKTVLKAPFSGIVASVSSEPNAKVSVGAGALSLYDASGMYLALDVNESDIQKMQTGEESRITIDALPGQVVTGTVGEISNVSKTSQDVVTYQVNVQFNPASLPVKTGMSATATITVESHQNVIQVPTRAIKTQGRNKSVEVLYGDKKTPVTIDVTTGASNSTMTEITSCVDTGNQCLRAGDAVAVTVTASTTTATGNAGGFGPGAFGQFPGGGGGFQRQQGTGR